MLFEEAIKILGVTRPSYTQDVVEAFRTKAKYLHPDKEDGDHNKFIALKEAYDMLKPLTIEQESSQLFTTCGKALCDLGHGIGGTKNGAPCPECEGHGYKSHAKIRWQDCPHCHGTGTVCCDCGGTGKFTQKNTKKVVNCRTCDGKGYGLDPYGNFKKFYASTCRPCWGTGRGAFPVGAEEVHELCYKCKGSGEIELFNPVFRKLTLLQVKK